MDRSSYLIMAGLLALFASAALACLLAPSEWRTSFAYQFLPQIVQRPSIEAVLTNSDTIASQAAYLESDGFLTELELMLESQGKQGWNIDRLKHALKVTHPHRSQMIQVQVVTAEKDMAQTLGTLLDRQYRQYIDDLYRDFNQQQSPENKIQTTQSNIPIKRLPQKPMAPVSTHDTPKRVMIFLSAFAGLFGLMAITPAALSKQSSHLATQSILEVVNELLKTKGQQVIVMMPVTSSGHLNASLHLGGMLSQFGRDAIVLDVDLSHRMLSRKIPTLHPHGIMEHLLDPDLKKPYLDSLSGARVIPMEATLDADKIVEYSQLVQRLPKIWERWPGSVVLLDLSQWHESYQQFLPEVAHVIFYVPPNYKASVLLPQVFKGKYQVPVSIVEIQPDL